MKQIPNFDDVDFGKITCNMVVQFDCLGFMVSCPRLHEGPKINFVRADSFCTAAIAL